MSLQVFPVKATKKHDKFDLYDEIKKLVKENSISLVVDKKYILGGGSGYDITKVIVEKLNKDLPSLNLK